jgi:hypothetical protein
MRQAALNVPCSETPGARFGLDISVHATSYRVAVVLNGARTATARRRTLDAALRWGRQVAADQGRVLGVTPVQLRFA